MWINLKPYTVQPYSYKALPYSVGISRPRDYIDQKRRVIQIKPGYHVSIKVLPDIVTTGTDFDDLELEIRKCKFSHETDGLKMLKTYTRIGCEFECAAEIATTHCKCLPWFLPNNFTNLPLCDLFGGHCFNQILSDDKYYKKCPEQCLDNCQDSDLLILQSFLPINEVDVCTENSLIYQHFEHSLRQEFILKSYQTLVEGGSIPDIAEGFSNGSLCRNYVLNYLSLVTVESPTSSLIMSKREKRITFYDKLSAIGGKLGLCVGMSIFSIFECTFFTINLIFILIKLLYNVLRSLCRRQPSSAPTNEYDETDIDLDQEIRRLHVSKYCFISHAMEFD